MGLRCNCSGSVQQSNGFWGAQCHPLCTKGLCSSPLPWLHTHAAGVHHVHMNMNLVQFSENKSDLGPLRWFPTWTKAHKVRTTWFASKNPSWSKHIHSQRVGGQQKLHAKGEQRSLKLPESFKSWEKHFFTRVTFGGWLHTDKVQSY